MKKASDSSVEMSRHIYEWLNVHVPLHETNSKHTLKSYQITLSLYLSFLEKEKGIGEHNFSADCFEKCYIEEWLIWIVAQRQCGDSTRNNRLASHAVTVLVISGIIGLRSVYPHLQVRFPFGIRQFRVVNVRVLRHIGRVYESAGKAPALWVLLMDGLIDVSLMNYYFFLGYWIC